MSHFQSLKSGLMQKSSKKAFFFFLLIIFFWILANNHFFKLNPVEESNVAPVILKNNVFYAEIVSNQKDLERGLGGRSDLCEKCLMVFRFPASGRYSFWMKDMLFPLDIVWINKGKVVHIEKSVQPSFTGTLTPEADADIVIEMNAAKTENLGINVGDTINL